MGSVNRKSPGGGAVPGTIKITGGKAMQALPQQPRKVRKYDKLGKQIEKRTEIQPLLARWGKDDQTLTSAELARLHRVLSAIERTRTKKTADDIFGMIERSELRLFSKRITENKEKLTVPELKRYRQVACWQLEGDDRDQLLTGIDLMIKAAEQH